MEWLTIWAAFLVVCSYSVVTAEDPTYAVLIPQLMRPGQDFDVCVNLLQTTGNDVTVMAKLQSVSDESVLVSETETFSPGSQNTMTLKIPTNDLETKYMFLVEGSGGLTFSNESLVSVSFKSLIILIQMDKAIYQPAQTVMYRIMALDAELKPYSGTFEVQILDQDQNKMLEFQESDTKDRECAFIMGGEFPLATHPPLGEWKIVVKTETDDTAQKSFSVEEYVLPNVEVKLDLPSMFHHTFETLDIVVKALYTYGKPVSGKAVVEIYLERYNSNSRDYFKKKLTVNVVAGEAKITLTHKDILGLYQCGECSLSQYPYYSTDLVVKATVTDEVTEEVFVADGKVPLMYRLLKIEFLPSTPDTYKEGLDWTGFVKVTRADDTPLKADDKVDEEDVELKVEAEFSYSEWDLDTKQPDSEPITDTYSIPASGIVVITRKMKVGYKSVNLNVRYPEGNIVTKSRGKQVTAYRNLEKSLSRDDKAIQVSVEDQSSAIKPSDDPVTFTVKTNEGISMFWYKILSKGNIVAQGKESASGKTNTFDVVFDEALAQSASPTARIIVWYFTSSGEVIVDSVELVVDGTFANDVQLEFSKEKVEPGKSVSVTITSEPKSCVGVLAVDKSVLLLRSGNDITRAEVDTGLGEFDSNRSPQNPLPWFDKKRKRRSFWYWPRYVSGKDTKEVFENAGVIIMTDAYIHEEPQSYDYRYYFMEMDGVENEAVGGALPDGAEDDDAMAGSEQDEEDVVEQTVRELFPETWLWSMFNVSGSDGKVVIDETAPDTITSWVATAFAISKKNGIGIMESPAELTVFKSCFADIRLPFSAVRSEELKLEVVIFNYESTKQKITVSLKKAANKAFYARGLNELKPTTAQEVQQEVTVQPGDGEEITFDIKPVKLGEIPVEVHISSKLCSDALRKDLTVEAEGEPCDYSESFFMSLENEGETKQVPIVFAKDVVEDSQRISVSVIGDIMGSSIANLERLIKQPGGCGEQNMLNFAPNIYVLNYFEATDTGTQEQISKAKGYIQTGYQNEQNYKRSDWSYSAFGDRDPSGSTWLTAFVLRCYRQATPYHSIPNEEFISGTAFLLKHHNKDGSFEEPGRVIHADMQGDAAKGIPLTAYIAKVLNEILDKLDPSGKSAAANALVQTQSYLEGELPNIKENAYSLALVCYFLCDINSTKADKCMEHLEKLAVQTASSTYWDLGDVPMETDIWYRKPPSNNIEATSYGLLIYCLKGDTAKAAMVTKWLSSQRSSLGGYGSTQDTVIGLQALSTFAAKVVIAGNTGIDVDIAWNSESHSFKTITKNNADVLQLYEINDAADTSEMTVDVQGSGTVLIQVNVFFNKEKSEGANGYELTVDSKDDDGIITITACARFVLQESGMTVMEIEMLTEYLPLLDDLLDKYSRIGLKKVEFNQKTVALYFDKLTDTMQCIEVSAKPASEVKNLQPASTSIYSYYASNMRDSALYLPESLMTGNDGSTTEDVPGLENVLDGSGGVAKASNSILLSAALALCLAVFFRMG